MLQRVRPESLVTKVYQAIKGAILENRFVAGQELSIEGLAQELGVSSTPVREALARLNADGLVELVPNKRPYVTPITDGEIHQIYEVRKVLEPYAVSIIVEKLGRDSTLEERLLMLENKIKRVQRRLSSEGTSFPLALYDEYIEADHALQNLIAEGVGEGLLQKIVVIINSYVFRLRLFPQTASRSSKIMRMKKVCAEHLEIIEATLNNDQCGVIDAITRHLENGEARTLHAFKEKGRGRE